MILHVTMVADPARDGFEALKQRPAKRLPASLRAGRVIGAKGFDPADTILRGALREQVGSTVKRLHREGAIVNVGVGRASKWKLLERTGTG